MEKLRVLQISDIHWSKTPELLDEYKDIREKMIEDLSYYYEQNKEGFDKILVCGDVAFSGNEKEYEKAKTFLQELCRTIHCNESKVFIVPGNHDKNVKADLQSTREILHKGFSIHPQRDEFLTNILQTEYITAKNLYIPFKEYARFTSKDFYCPEHCMVNALSTDKSEFNEDSDLMYWVDKDDLSGYDFNIYGFNTALISDLSDYDKNPKRINGHKQILPKLAYKVGSVRDNQINVLMCHHPMDYIVDGESIQKDLDKRYQVQLYGHVHIPRNTDDKKVARIFSGALQPELNDDTYSPVFNIIEFSIDKRGARNYLIVKLTVHCYQNDKFVKDEKESHVFEIGLNNSDRWHKTVEETQDKKNKEIDQREIIHQFISLPYPRDIVESIYQGMWDDSEPSYSFNPKFFGKITEDNKWEELYKLMNR